MDQEKLNKIANEYLSKSKKVNFIKLLNSREEGKRISVVGRYVERERKDFINYLDVIYDRNEIYDDYYYGLSPYISNLEIGKLIKGDTFLDVEHLKMYMKSVGKYFMLHNNENSRKYFEALFARTLVKIETSYGFKLYASQEIKDEIKEIAKKDIDLSILIDTQYTEDTIFIKGRLNQENLKLLQGFYLKRNEKENKTEIVKEKTHQTISCLYEKDSPYMISQYYGAYYSGVIPSLLKIEEEKNAYNAKVISLILYLERTTFALEDSIDKTRNNDLSILSSFKNLLSQFEKDEDDLEEKYIYSDLTDTNYENINKYLENTLNTRVIGVSSNVVTRDGYLLFGHRSNRVVDASYLYPSFNGQSEIYDSHVNFYNESVYEDLPTITLENKNRLDFKNEFAREMLAELNISGFDKNYEYYGVSCLGMNQKLWKNNNGVKEDDYLNRNLERRLHFNILAIHELDIDLMEVSRKWKEATESFENLEIYGVKLNSYKSKREFIGNKLISFLKGLMNYKDLITSLVILLIAIMTFSFVNTGLTDVDLASSILNWIFFVLSILIFVLDFIVSLKRFIKKKRISFLMNLFKKKNKNEIEHILNKENLKLLKLMKRNEILDASTKEEKAKVKEKYLEKTQAFASIGLLLNLLFVYEKEGK